MQFAPSQRHLDADSSPSFCAGRKLGAVEQALLWTLLHEDPECPSRVLLDQVTQRQIPIAVSIGVCSGYVRKPVIATIVQKSQPSRPAYGHTVRLDFPIGGFSPPEGRLARGCKPPAFSRFLFQSAVKSAESF